MKTHGKFLTHLFLTPMPDGRHWRVDRPFAYRTSWRWHFTVPTGFKTDLASIPRAFWSVLPPFGKYTEAAVLHDWLYRTHGMPRPVADAVLYEAMQLGHTGFWARWTIYIAVRMFGWAAWRDEKRWCKPGQGVAKAMKARPISRSRA